MPVTRVPLEHHDIREELTRVRRYGLHLERSSAIRLTVPDPDSRRQSGAFSRRLLAPISKAKYERIRNYAETVQEACDQIEALSHGRLTDPDLPSEHSERGGSGLDSATMQHIVNSRVETAVAAAQAQQSTEIGALRSANDALQDQLKLLIQKLDAQQPKPQKKRGRPLGTPNKPKVPPPPAPEAAPA